MVEHLDAAAAKPDSADPFTFKDKHVVPMVNADGHSRSQALDLFRGVSGLSKPGKAQDSCGIQEWRPGIRGSDGAASGAGCQGRHSHVRRGGDAAREL